MAGEFIGHDTPGNLLLIEGIKNRFHPSKELGVPGRVGFIALHHVFDQTVEEWFVDLVDDVADRKVEDGTIFECFDQPVAEHTSGAARNMRFYFVDGTSGQSCHAKGPMGCCHQISGGIEEGSIKIKQDPFYGPDGWIPLSHVAGRLKAAR